MLNCVREIMDVTPIENPKQCKLFHNHIIFTRIESANFQWTLLLIWFKLFISNRFTMLWTFSFSNLSNNMQKHFGGWWNHARDHRYAVKRWLWTATASWAIVAVLFIWKSSFGAVIVSRRCRCLADKPNRNWFSEIALLSQSAIAKVPSSLLTNIFKWLDRNTWWLWEWMLFWAQWNFVATMFRWG